jgi:rhodanese-related sulfurtransferase
MAVRTISPQELARLRDGGKAVELIDVRTPAEFDALHAADARLVPLDRLDPAAILSSRNGSGGEPIYVICESGGRSARAAELFQAVGFANVFSVEGGTAAWERAGLPVVRGARRVIPLERQVRIGAGSLVLVGLVLGWLVHPALFGLSAFMGAGLVFSGVTGFCGMALLLAKAPWNRGAAAAGCAC